jgi:hypothetical protein
MEADRDDSVRLVRAPMPSTMRPESDAMLRAIPSLKERLNVNVELASPDQFIPVPAGWEEWSPVITRIGRVTVHHYDLVEPELYRFPAIDPPSFRRAVDAAFPP